MRVLVVEDYAPIRKAVAKSLREAGFAVDETGDGEEGLWYATSNNGTTKARPAGVPRNSLEGPGSARLDLRWSHAIELGRGEDGPKATVGVDAFNVLNRVNYNPYVGNMSSPFFGQSVSAQAARRFQLSLRLEF